MDLQTRRRFLNQLAVCSVSSGLFANGVVANPTPEVTERPLKNRVGVTHVDGGYHFTDEDYLNEGAKRISDLGSRVVKLWFHRVASKYPYNSDWPDEFASMVEIAKHRYFRELFQRDFETYVLVAYAMDDEGSLYRGNGGMHYFLDGVGDGQARVEEESFYELTKHLLDEYRGTGKEFILQHWQGDWAILPHDVRSEVSPNNIRPTDPEPTDTAIDGMIRWLNARQRGVERARQEVDSDVRVLHATEVNMVIRAMRGQKRVINHVVPKTNVDLVSHNSYREMWMVQSEWSLNEAPEHFRKILDYVNGHAPDPNEYTKNILVEPDRNVFVGEYGLPFSWVGTNTGNWISQIATHVSLDWGATWTLFWQVYDNEDGKGYWLIRPDGSTTPLFDYFQRITANNKLDPLLQFSELVLDFDEAVAEHEINDDVGKEDSRWLTFACSKLELLSEDGSVVSSYNIGVPDEEPILTKGVSFPGENVRTWRWFVGESETEAQTYIYLLKSEVEEASLIRIVGRPAPSGEITARVSIGGQELQSVIFPLNAGWEEYTIELPSERTSTTSTQTLTATENPTITATKVDNKTGSVSSDVDSPGFGIIAGLLAILGGAVALRKWRENSE